MMGHWQKIRDTISPPATDGPTNGFVLPTTKYDMWVLPIILVLAIGYFFVR